MVIQWRDSTFDKPSVCRLGLATLSSFYRYAMDHGYAKANPVSGIKNMPKQGTHERWEEQDALTFIEKAPDHLSDVVALALYTGQRISDLIKIKWIDVSDKYILVHQQKTGRKLYIPINKKLVFHLERRKKVMKRMRRRIPYVIFNTKGDPWQPTTLSAAVHNAAKNMGLPAKPFHGLRKTTASILAEMGCTPSQIMAITGHSTLKEVTRYTAEADQRRLAEQAMERMTR